jgi:hypothetical protein
MVYAVGYKSGVYGEPYILKAAFMLEYDAVVYMKASSNKKLFIKQLPIPSYGHWIGLIDAFSEGEPQ